MVNSIGDDITLTIDGVEFKVVTFDYGPTPHLEDVRAMLGRLSDWRQHSVTIPITQTPEQEANVRRLLDSLDRAAKLAIPEPERSHEPRRRRAQWKDEQSHYRRRKGR